MKSSGLCARAAISFFAALLAAFGILGSTASLAQAGRLLQISTRAQALTGDDAMIAGFIIDGSAPKTVVITVAGPSLAGVIANNLRDPTLTLVRASDNAVLKTNDNWEFQDIPADVSAIVGSGFAPGERLEPAIIATLPPGAYTAIVRGIAGGTGIAVVAVYEVDRPDVPLANLSTRAKVLTGDDVVIGGFAIGPSDPHEVVVTVAGPSLNGIVPNALQNPTLTLVRMSDRAVVASNDDWQSQANPADVAALEEAGLQPGHAREPAIIATLPPGLYTAIATGVDGGTGVAVVGVYKSTRAVAITSADNTSFTAGTAGTFTVTTSGSPPATSVTATGALPPGVTFTPGTTTGTLSGTPAPGSAGTYTLTITASNGTPPNATQTFTLTVNEAPAITSAASAFFNIGSPGTHTVVATGFPAPTLSVSGALPSGVTFDPATGVLSGTPAAGTAGTYPLTFTATNGTAPDATQNFTLTVTETVVITSANAATFTVGQAGTFTITTSATPVANDISISGALPTGVTLGATSGTGTAVLSGTPAGGTGGTYTVTITASNGGVTPNGTQTFTLTVNEAPTITSGNATTFTVGVNGTFNFAATGFPAATFSSTGALPVGVTLTPAGVLQGTPAAGTGGTYPIVVTAANGTAPDATQNFTLTVNQAPAITSAAGATFTVAGAPGSHTFTATGFPAPSFGVAGTLPGGVTVVGNLLSGTPADGSGGTYSLTVTATNGVAPTAMQAFVLTVNESPTITSANNVAFQVGVAATAFVVTADGFPASTFTTLGPLPVGVTLAADGTLSGTPGPGSAGVYPFQITAANGVAPDATQSFTLTVTDPADAVDDSFTIAHDTPLNVAAPGILANDTGTPAPSIIQVNGSACAPPCGPFPTTAGGMVAIASLGAFVYTPPGAFVGADTFTYTIQNPTGTDTATVTIDVTNALPVVDLDGAAGPTIDFATNFVEGAGAVEIVDKTQLSVTDADSANLTGAIVSITNIQNPGLELLGFTCTALAPACVGAIQVADVSYDPNTGELTIAANAPLADYEALLRTVTYNNTSPAPAGAPRVIEFELNDGLAVNDPIAVATVTLAGANDPPVITAPSTTPGTALPTPVDTALVFAGNVSVSDPDAGTSNVQVTLAATNGTMTLSTTAGLSVSGNASANVTATGPLTDLNAALNGMAFNPTPAFTGAATLVITADDLGNTGNGGPLTDTHTVHINVDNRPTVSSTNPVNAAPAVSSTSTITLNFSENVTVTGASFTIACTPSGSRPFTFSGSGTSIVILTPSSQLPAGESCTVTVIAAQVTDSIGQTMAANHVFSFTVNSLPTVTATTPVNAATGVQLAADVGVTFSEPVNATTSSFTISCSTSSVHAFAISNVGAVYTLNPTVDFTAGETCTVTVVAAQVTDVDGGQNMAADHVFSFTIGTPPAITSGTSATFTVGTLGSHTVTTTGTPTVSSIALVGSLPAGVSFNYGGGATAALSGTVNDAGFVGVYPLSFTASNGITPDAAQNFTLTVQCPAITLAPANGSIFTATYNQSFTQAFAPSGGNAPYSFNVVGALPSVAFSGSNLTGTPSNTGSFGFTVQAVDNFGCTSAVQSYTLNVNPAAGNDAYSALGNVLVDSSTGAGTPFTVVSNDSFPAGTASITAFDATSVNGGTVTMTTSGMSVGRFTYNPPVGYIGADSFTYTLSSNGRTAVGTVTFTVAGMVWFIDNNTGACPASPCDGRLTNPFVDTTNFQAVNVSGTAPNPQDGHAIFVYGSSTTYAGDVTLRNSQRLVGQGATGTLAALGNVTPQNGQTLPSTGGGAPKLGGQLTVGQGNFIHGVTLQGSTALRSTAAFGTLTVNDNVTIDSAGMAIDLSSGTLSGALAGVTSNGSATANVVLTNVATVGTFALGTGTLTGGLAGGLAINGQDGSFSYGGKITNTNAAGSAVAISNKTGGTVTLSGNINEGGGSGGRILVQNNNSGTNVITFSGSQVKVNTGGNTGVSLTSNTGATINFTGGGLDIATTTASGLLASGGGTVNVSGSANVVATTNGGTAVDLAGVGGAVTFRSVNVTNGGATGIFLQNTTGSFTVTGNSSGQCGGLVVNNTTAPTLPNAADCTGGHIQNAATGIRLDNATNVSLTRMRISGQSTDNFGIYGTSVNGFTLANSWIGGTIGATTGGQDAPLVFGKSNPGGLNGLLGNNFIRDTTIEGGIEHNAEFYNQSGTFNLRIERVVVKMNSLAGGSDGILLEMQGTADATVIVDNSQFDDNKSQAIQMNSLDNSSVEATVSNSRWTKGINHGNEGVLFANGANSHMVVDINNNRVSGFGGVGIYVGQTPGNASASSLLHARIRNNQVTSPANATNHSVIAFLTSTLGGAASARVQIDGNTVTQNSTSGTARAILVDTPDAGTMNNIDVTLAGNTASTTDINAPQAVNVTSRQAGTACFSISGNTVTGAVIPALRARQGGTATVNLHQTAAGGDAATVLAASNPASTTTTLGTIGLTGAACLLPTTPTLPP